MSGVVAQLGVSNSVEGAVVSDVCTKPIIKYVGNIHEFPSSLRQNINEDAKQTTIVTDGRDQRRAARWRDQCLYGCLLNTICQTLERYVPLGVPVREVMPTLNRCTCPIQPVIAVKGVDD